MNRENQIELAGQLTLVVADAIKEDIELTQENVEDFMFALSAMMPVYFHNKFTGEDKNTLEYNHIVNHLILENEIEKQSSKNNQVKTINK